MTETSWWDRARHADRRPLLIARNRIQARLRAWFAERDFVEVDPAAMQRSPGNEVHLHAFGTLAVDETGASHRRWLHTSPEFAMKKLLAAGERRIFAFSHVWRNRERGPLHAPEFTMLEWYRAEEGYETLMEDCAAFLQIALEESGAQALRWRGVPSYPRAGTERRSVAEALARHGIDLPATLPGGQPDRAALAAQAGAAGIGVDETDTWSDIFSKCLVGLVEPGLGEGRPVILDRYPAPEAALARPAPDDPAVAERFELFACGVELANGFGELTDAALQEARLVAAMDEKQRIYGEAYPVDAGFIAALDHMPAASGCALGFDRLVMLATGAPNVESVMWAPPY
ncbi:EF-P lysine aminoacylase EpmA [Wenxinia saemankumensis]|uniref:Lysyl-tRNA synthetase, class 2 n=1 Tax=Wenxinia saemankumensis TaxID=1447782 RepID=A0A1M6FNT3_9RHOB|nr:EF-P lysine aminoacylase EpmA [Wenxinia saemankumensis]SHI99313.1 lysyl-tRNA synthetase, class 2 [Wenxinia saemankumensis]